MKAKEGGWRGRGGAQTKIAGSSICRTLLQVGRTQEAENVETVVNRDHDDG